MKAIVTEKSPYQSELKEIEEPEWIEGFVKIQVAYSSLNYKDALAITGKGKILKRFPLTPGIDACGTVEKAGGQSGLKPGDQVLVTGCGLGETENGGFAEKILVPEPWVIALPKNLSTVEAMTYGTAGFTAALCLWRMEQMNQTPDMGPILITGASGGVGSLATLLFSNQGYNVHACSSKTAQQQWLKDLGAREVLAPDFLLEPARPLESASYGGAIDNLGGQALSSVLSRVHLWGNVACVGLAVSHELPTTVMPMILRGVSLLGISSANTPRDLRLQIWEKLSNEWKPKALPSLVSQEVSLEGLTDLAPEMLANQTHGRTLVKISE